MTTHELAKKLLEQPDIPVYFESSGDGATFNITEVVLGEEVLSCVPGNFKTQPAIFLQ